MLSRVKTRFGLSSCSVSLYIQSLNLALCLFLLGMCTGAFLALRQPVQCPRQAVSFPPALKSIILRNRKKGESRDIVGCSCRLPALQGEPPEAQLVHGSSPCAQLATTPRQSTSCTHKRLEEHGGLEPFLLWLGPKHLNWARCKNANSRHVLGSSMRAQLCLQKIQVGRKIRRLTPEELRAWTWPP